MSTSASNTTFLNRFDGSRSGRLISFLSRSKAFTISFSSATSEEIPGVEVLELTLATTGLSCELRTLDLLSMIL
ncbi:hypothetical protein Tco_0283582, partial [Tanacetum coccineum]